MLILILTDAQYLQNVDFYFEKCLNDQMHSSSDSPTPPDKKIYP